MLFLPYATELEKLRFDYDVLRLIVTSTGEFRHPNEACPSKSLSGKFNILFQWCWLCLKCFVVILFLKCLYFTVLILCFTVYRSKKGKKNLISYLYQSFSLQWYSLSWSATLFSWLWFKWLWKSFQNQICPQQWRFLSNMGHTINIWW